MKIPYFLLLLVLFAGCASQSQRQQTKSEKALQEDPNFYNDGLWPRNTSEESQGRQDALNGIPRSN